MPHLTLTSQEVAILKNATRKGDPDQGFQELLSTLEALVDGKSGRVFLSQHTLDLIQRYGAGSGSMTWKGILLRIFGRTLGSTLGRNRDESGRLTKPEESARGL